VLDGLRRATTEHRVPEHPVQVCHCGARNSATVPAVSWQEAEPLTVNKCVNLDHVRARTLSNTGSIRSLLDGRPKLGTAIAVRLGMAAGSSVQAQGVVDDMTMLRWTRQCSDGRGEEGRRQIYAASALQSKQTVLARTIVMLLCCFTRFATLRCRRSFRRSSRRSSRLSRHVEK
jgi:hypothetical protein